MNDKERNEFESNEQNYYGQPEQVENGVESQTPEQQGYYENQPSQGFFDFQSDPNSGLTPDAFGKPDNGRGRFFGLGVTSMILGIISILCCCCKGVFIVSAATAIVFAGIRMSKKPDGFSIAGLVTGIIGAIFNALMLVVVFSGEAIDLWFEVESLSESVSSVIKLFVLR